MKLTRQQWITGALACVTTLLVATIAQSQTPTTGIYTTKHNLGANSTGGNNKISDNAEICVFCHTPHGAARNDSAPLWNKTLPLTASYTLYDTNFSSSIDGEVLPVGSVSITCLSCHDGSQAMDNIINATGSGLYDPLGGGPSGRTYSWTGSSVDSNGVLLSGTTNVANLGRDLTNDHPIGIEYCGGGLGVATTIGVGLAGGTCKDSDFKVPLSATINGAGVWWVETGTSDNARTRTDMILYTRTFLGSGDRPSVECASCHDPHVSDGQSAGAGRPLSGATFLRIQNTNSAVCLACHIK